MGAPSKKAQNKTALAQATAMLEGATKRARAATERLNKSLERVEKTARGAAKGVRQLNGAIRNIDNAFGNMLLNVIKKLALLGTSGAVVLTMVFAMWAKIITDFTDKVGDKWDGMMDRVRKRTINGVESVTEQWQSMREKMIDDNEAMFKSTKESFRGIVNELKKALGAMGFKGADLARAMEDGGTTGGGGRASKATRGPGARRAARGLRLPGRGLRDTVALGNDVMAAPGELVVNRHTEARINHLLAAQGTTLGHEVWNEGRPHNIPATQQRLARGGRKKGGSVGTVVEAIGPEAIAPFTYASDHDGTNRHMHIAMSTSSAIVAFGRLLQSMGYQVSEHPAFGGVGGGHAPTGYHYSGQAIDVNTANNETTAEVARVAALLRGGKVGGAIGGMAGASIPAHQMRRRRGFQGGGPAHRAASQRAIDILTGAAQGKINAKAGRAGPMGPGGQVGGTMSMAQIERLARSVGMPNPHLMAAIAMAESGGRVGVINSIGATGLWQVLQSAHPQYSEKMLLSAKGNALAAKEILGSQGLSAWEAYTMGMHTQYMARGGRTKIGGMPDWGGWNAKGGSFTVNRPTLFGAGESGQETVHISPKGKGGRRGGGVSVHIDKIEYNGKGDVKKAIEEEFRNLRVDLIGVGPEDD